MATHLECFFVATAMIADRGSFELLWEYLSSLPGRRLALLSMDDCFHRSVARCTTSVEA